MRNLTTTSSILEAFGTHSTLNRVLNDIKDYSITDRKAPKFGLLSVKQPER